MSRLLVLDDPDQTRGGRRPRGSVVSVLADGQSPGLMAGAQFLVLDVPDLDVPTAQATYLAGGIPQSARDAEAAEEARYRADATGEEVTSSFGNSALAAGNWLFLDIASVASSPTKLTVWVEVTVD